jgi:hypothetical protein
VTASTPEEWNELSLQYQKVYWKKNPELGVRTLLQLQEAGKIVQTRLENPPRYADINNGIWADTEESINWIYPNTSS